MNTAAILPAPNVTDKPTIIRVLLVEDDEDDYILTRTLMSQPENRNLRLDWVEGYDEAFERITANEYDVYLIDYRLGERTGIDLIQEATDAGCQAPMILLTGQDDQSIDYSAMAIGASDYLVKGRIDAQLLGRSVRYALRQAESLAKSVEQEKKYRSLFERSFDAIFVADSHMHFRDVNPSVEKLLGYSRDELLQINPARLFDRLDALRQLRFSVREFNQIKDFETTIVSKEGRKRICLISVWAVDDAAGRPVWYQGIVRDITEQKKAQQELIIAEKLTMTGKLARSIAHEVRNPLTNLSLALDQLRDELGDNQEETELYTDIIGRNVERISTLITDMLNSSKPRELDRKPQDLNDVVKDTLGFVTDRIKLKQMQLTTNYSTDDCTAPLDLEQVRMALTNILINAVEAMEPGQGKLWIDTSCIDDTQVCVVIRDNGSGIAPENIQRLFDPFFTGKQSGMGLGLTATQNIVTSHRGHIDVDSEMGQGTTFRITFPK
ncbi:hybrid sensor histidine kinase/response regulator [Fibrivirga algicola]|uniref:histidine kinase n=1 Tax=Fibrivirga algicola TaxID=2950420 RepID=A0ABX0QBM6_9BACT|nr:PAS domain S-box protein [Fibrivirga algicola]ARK10993.1 hybrid sensor histidine kinase/response regulator [Fibrella sp. ES10-3-2-2]NID09755.1 PAS domain S-box protein [Fibrivirga algicola]